MATPLLSKVTHDGYMDAVAYHQNEVFEAAILFARTEGFLVAPETSHAIKGVIDEALRCKETGEGKVILFNNSGHGHFDLASYDAYLRGKLVDYEYPESLVREAIAKVPKV